VRRAGALGLAVLVAAAGVFGLVSFFQGRDDATFSSVEGPGQLEPDRGHAHRSESSGAVTIQPPTSGTHAPKEIPRDGAALDDDQVLHALEAGDVVLVYNDSATGRALRRLATDVAGPFSPELAAAGQAVVLDDLPGRITGVTALAWRHRLRVGSPSAPELRDFIEFWLGRGAE